MSDLERRFANAVREALHACHTLGYHPKVFEGMVTRLGPLAAAKKLICSGAIEEGLERLKKLDRLELSVEALALRPGFRDLFSTAEREAAKWKLKQMGWTPPAPVREEGHHGEEV